MFNKILMLCQGNICRSPMAEALLSQMQPGICVDSAGIAAMVGQPAEPNVQAWMVAQGIDISVHRAKQVTKELLLMHELIFVMDGQQEKEIVCALPQICGKVHKLGKWGNFDIPDPYRRSTEVVKLAFELIKQGLHEWQGRLWG